MSVTKLLMYIILPVCTLIFFCRDFVTLVLLGPKWEEGAMIIGCWALMLGISVFIYSFPAEVYKSKGIPKYLFFYQLSYIVLMVPICIYAALINFWDFVYTRCWVVGIQIILFFIFSKAVLGWHPAFIMSHIKKPMIINILFFGLCIGAFWMVNNMFWRVGVAVLMLGLYGGFIWWKLKDELIKSKNLLTKKELAFELSLDEKESEINNEL